MPEHPPTRPNEAFGLGFYSDADMDFGVRILLGLAPGGGSDVGEVLETISTVKDGDQGAWERAFTALGERVLAIADTAARRGHLTSAAEAFLRAANYLSVAVASAARQADAPATLAAFRRHRAAWDRFIDTVAYPSERVDIPYCGTTLPGYLVRPADGRLTARSTLIMANGSDGPISTLWATGASAALERGYSVLLFDGPGQQSMLFERAIPFRHDWEAVITPVVDFLRAPHRGSNRRPGRRRCQGVVAQPLSDVSH